VGEWHTQTDSRVFCIVLLQLDIQSKNFPSMIPISPMTRASTTYVMGRGAEAIAVPDARMGAEESSAATAAEWRSLRISS
jgi:hypothetical protein